MPVMILKIWTLVPVLKAMAKDVTAKVDLIQVEMGGKMLL